ncbi:MAG: hypothetical protein MI750_12175, partial [Xanthomonadales bacterium]|nr:hypothetical protein [Xanthomonadales bacterium]
RNIYAQHGILLCELRDGNSSRLITPIVASSMGNDLLLGVAENLQERYELDYKPESHGTYRFLEHASSNG